MEEILKTLEERKLNVKEQYREEWYELSIRLAKLSLEKGDSVESIIEFIKS